VSDHFSFTLYDFNKSKVFYKEFRREFLIDIVNSRLTATTTPEFSSLTTTTSEVTTSLGLLPILTILFLGVLGYKKRKDSII
jgi:hypothetical protein